MPTFYEQAKGEHEEIIVSNDTYFFFANGEPCLDEDNIDEIDELRERYKYGFEFTGNPVFVEDSDLVEISIVPNILVESAETYTHYFNFIGDWRVEFRYENEKQIAMRYFNTKSGEVTDKQVCDIRINKANKPEFKTAKGSIFPLWSPNKGMHQIKIY